MKKVLTALCLLFFVALSACESTGGTPPSNSGGGGCSSKKGPSDDQVAALKQDYVDGKRKADNNIPLPGTCTVGQIWEVQHMKDGKQVTETFTVAHRIGRNLVVEHMTAGGVVLAYEVDRSRPASEGNVKRAWVGKKGWDPTEIKLQSGWVLPHPNMYTDWPSESFADLEMGGKKWSGKVYTKGDTRVWIADRGYFNGIIKMTGPEEVMLVKADFKDKPKLLLSDWEYVK